MPVIVLTGHTPMSRVAGARDSGASFVVKKPISAQVLHDRICWAAQSQRPFISAGAYVGPDRRFRAEPVAPEAERRLSILAEPGVNTLDDSGRDRVIRASIAAIESSLAGCGSDGLNAHAQGETLKHGARVARLAAEAEYDHLARTARGLCDVAATLDPSDPRGTAPVAVYLQAIQLLAPGNEALTAHGAERVLGALTRTARPSWRGRELHRSAGRGAQRSLIALRTSMLRVAATPRAVCTWSSMIARTPPCRARRARS